MAGRKGVFTTSYTFFYFFFRHYARYLFGFGFAQQHHAPFFFYFATSTTRILFVLSDIPSH